MFTALIVIASIVPVIFIVIELKKGGAAGTVAKAAASLCFVLLGASSLSDSFGKAGTILLMGLVLGLIGDIFLGVFQSGDPATALYLPAGMLAFAAEHFFVAVAVSKAAGFDVFSLVVALAVGAVCTAVVGIVEPKLFKFEFGTMLVPALGYMFILASAMSYYVAAFLRDPSFLIVVIGMGLFIISDLVLSAMYFGGKDKNGVFKTVNLATYYAGQILFAVSIGCACTGVAV